MYANSFANLRTNTKINLQKNKNRLVKNLDDTNKC